MPKRRRKRERFEATYLTRILTVSAMIFKLYLTLEDTTRGYTQNTYHFGCRALLVLHKSLFCYLKICEPCARKQRWRPTCDT